MLWSRDLHRCRGTTADEGHAFLDSVVSDGRSVLTLLDFRKRLDLQFDLLALASIAGLEDLMRCGLLYGQLEASHLSAVADEDSMADKNRMIPRLAINHFEPCQFGMLVGLALHQRQFTGL